MTKEQWVRLAEAYMAENGYWEDLLDAKKRLAKKHGIDQDFIGLDSGYGPLLDTVASILGDDFCYFYYDCSASYSKFNKGVTLQDGSHPDVYSLEDLYYFAYGGK